MAKKPKGKFKSQYGQDRWVLQALKNKRGGYFIECGAYNGVSLSNTHVLEYHYGWTGICIEPDNRVFKLLQESRGCITDNSCVGSSRGTCKFVEVGTLGGIDNDYSAKHRARVADANPDYKKRTVEKQMVVLSDVLDRHSAPKICDYLSLDVEGAELRILKAFPFDRYAFRVMTVEHNGFPKAMTQLRQLLESKGYRIVKTTSADYYVVNTKKL